MNFAYEMRADWLVPSGHLSSSKFGPFAFGLINTGDYMIERCSILLSIANYAAVIWFQAGGRGIAPS